MNKYSENNKEIIILVLLIIVLAITAGVLTFFNSKNPNLNIDENINNNSTNQDTIVTQNTYLSGIYVFDFKPTNDIDEDLVSYYSGVEFRFTKDNTFTAYFVEGFFITGTYLITNNTLTCTTEYFSGQHFTNNEVSNILYIFDITQDNSIELTEKIGTLTFLDTDGIEKLLTPEKYDEIGSIFTYSETSVNNIPTNNTTPTNNDTIIDDNSNTNIESNSNTYSTN